MGFCLFIRFSDLDDYDIPRIEKALMKTDIEEIVELLGPRVLLIEYGNGSSAKTRIMLDHLREPVAYVPIDI